MNLQNKISDHLVWAAQNAALAQLTKLPSMKNAKLCGGTALSRFHLHHRVSFDLDFFLPEGFDPVRIGMEAKAAGIPLAAASIVSDKNKANQWHGSIRHQKTPLKISFVEDTYYDVYPSVYFEVDGLFVRSESVEGLYHRKLLTVTHASDDGVTPQGGRQTARDLFDLWALDKTVAALDVFMASVPYDYPRAAFEEGLFCMPWFDLRSEFQEIMASERFEGGKDVETVRTDLFHRMNIVVDFPADNEDSFRKPSP